MFGGVGAAALLTVALVVPGCTSSGASPEEQAEDYAMKACGISLSADGAVSQEPEGDAADLGEFLSESPTYLADAESQAAAAASAANLDGRWSALADASAARLPFLERMVRWVEDNGANSSGLAESWPDLDRDGQEYNAANSRWRVECQALQDRLTADQPR